MWRSLVYRSYGLKSPLGVLRASLSLIVLSDGHLHKSKPLIKQRRIPQVEKTRAILSRANHKRKRVSIGDSRVLDGVNTVGYSYVANRPLLGHLKLSISAVR